MACFWPSPRLLPAQARGEEAATEAEGGLLERQGVIALASELVDEVARGGAGALFVVGEAGLGKTSVVDRAGRLAVGAGVTVGVGRGHPMETSLPFGLMLQALDGIGGRGLLGEDQPGPRSAGDRAAGFYRVLRFLLGQVRGALLLVLDDVHWADADSLALVSFLCRRLGPAPVGLIATLRPWPAEAQEVVEGLAGEGRGVLWRLAPLSEQAAGSLLQARLGREVQGPARRRAFELCAGNPLLLQQLAVAVGEGGEIPEAFGAGAAAFGRGVLLARFAGLPPGGMRCAQAASVLGSSFLPEVAALVAGLEGGAADAAVEALALTGLIRQQPGRSADFVHPLFRQALYDDLAGPVRARLHARAFAVLHARGLDASAAEHAVAAGLAGDLEAAGVLEKSGLAARRAGALATAVTWLDAAAAMAGEGASIGLLLARAEALIAAGQPGRAVAACRDLLDRPEVPVSARGKALWMLGRARVMTGDHDRAADNFEQASGIMQAVDLGTTVRVLGDAAFSAMITAGPGRALPIASRARELARSAGGELQIEADAVWGELAVRSGDPAGISAVEAAAQWLGSGKASRPGSVVVDPGTANSVLSFAFTMALVERLTEAERALAALRASADQMGIPDDIAAYAVVHGYVLTQMGRLDEALAAVNAALSLSDLAPLPQPFAAVYRAYIQLNRGDLDDSAHWCQRAEATATERREWMPMLILWDVLGHRRLREGTAAEACEHYTRLEATAHRMRIGEPCMPPWPRHAISAYLADGRPDDAERVLAWLDQAARRLPCRYPKIAAATGRAQLAEMAGDHAKAARHHQTAVALHGEVDLPLEHAETLLAFGAFLRRSGQPQAARSVLAKAVRVAEAAGAAWLAGLAKIELRVAGGRLRHGAAPANLSPQQERVASLAATGASNADIARQLSLSVSTVETHLEHIYAKRGIHSRYQLIAAATAARGGPKHSGSSPTTP